MSDMIGPGPQGNAMVGKVKSILLTPKEEWPRIDADVTTIGDLYKSWVIPLAAIGPVAHLIGSLVFGYSAFGITYRPSIMAAVSTAVVQYALTLVGVYLLALVIDWLAPQFDAVQNRTQAFKVAAYGATASWVAGIFGLVPALSVLGILGLYSLYLIYLGLPAVMKAPAAKAGGYTVVVVIATLVFGIVLAALTAPVAALFAPSISGGTLSAGTMSGSVNTPAGSLDLGKLEEAGKKLEASAQAMQNGQGKPAIAADVLQALLPAALPGGLARTSLDSGSAGAAGIGGSNAEARYASGETDIRLTVTDLGAMGGLAALGGAFNVQSSKQTATAYEKVGKVDGRMTTEKYDSTDKRGEYGTLVGDRIMVQAEGNAPSINAFKGAVAAVDLGKVEALAKQ